MLTRSTENESIARIFAKQPISLSLDIFDTTFIRRASIQEIFRRLGERLQREWADWSLDPVEFASWRQVSETRANREHGSSRFLLSDIYREFAKGYPLPTDRLDRLMALELEVEREHLAVIPEIKEKVAKEHYAGRAVLFLSDTYLPSEWLSDILREHGLWQDGDVLYASGEVRASKSRCELFEFAENKLGARLDNPLHLGDNFWSDLHQASASGWRAELFETAKPTSREMLLASHSPEFGSMPETLAAAARLARLRLLSSTSPQLHSYLETVSAVAAPIFIAYAHWCLQKAKRLGLKRLYFLTRDGIILQETFQALVSKLGEEQNIETKILAASRQVCRLSSLDTDAPELSDWTTYNSNRMTVTSCLFRVGLEPGDFETELSESGFPRKSWERPLSKSEGDRLSNLLHGDKFRQAIERSAGNARELFERYLEENGLFDGEPCALVDIGWRGATFNSLLSRLPDSARSSVHLFVLGFLGEDYVGYNGDKIHAYYCNNMNTDTECDGERIVALMEDFVAVKQGALVGFKTNRNDRVEPVFRTIDHTDLELERFALNQTIQSALIDWLPREQIEAWSTERMTPVWKSVLDGFCMTPTFDEVTELSTHMRDVDQSGHDRISVVTPYSWSELLWWGAGLRPLYAGMSNWPEGRHALTRGGRRGLMVMGEALHGRWPGIGRRLQSFKQKCGRAVGRPGG